MSIFRAIGLKVGICCNIETMIIHYKKAVFRIKKHCFFVMYNKE